MSSKQKIVRSQPTIAGEGFKLSWARRRRRKRCALGLLLRQALGRLLRLAAGAAGNAEATVLELHKLHPHYLPDRTEHVQKLTAQNRHP